jgi:hypothetical protein
MPCVATIIRNRNRPVEYVVGLRPRKIGKFRLSYRPPPAEQDFLDDVRFPRVKSDDAPVCATCIGQTELRGRALRQAFRMLWIQERSKCAGEIVFLKRPAATRHDSCLLVRNRARQQMLAAAVHKKCGENLVRHPAGKKRHQGRWSGSSVLCATPRGWSRIPTRKHRRKSGRVTSGPPTGHLGNGTHASAVAVQGDATGVPFVHAGGGRHGASGFSVLCAAARRRAGSNAR